MVRPYSRSVSTTKPELSRNLIVASSLLRVLAALFRTRKIHAKRDQESFDSVTRNSTPKTSARSVDGSHERPTGAGVVVGTLVALVLAPKSVKCPNESLPCVGLVPICLGRRSLDVSTAVVKACCSSAATR